MSAAPARSHCLRRAPCRARASGRGSTPPRCWREEREEGGERSAPARAVAGESGRSGGEARLAAAAGYAGDARGREGDVSGSHG
jgi:hypothetical protein